MENEGKKGEREVFFPAHFSLRRPHSCVNLRFVYELNWILKNEPLHPYTYLTHPPFKAQTENLKNHLI